MVSRILFLCALGSSRALLAASILEGLAEGHWDVWSTPTQDEQGRILAEQVLRDIAGKRGAAPKRLSKGALDRLLSHAWPGNVRELQNVIESAAILEDGPEIRTDAIHVGDARLVAPIAEAVQRRYSLAQLEDAYIREVLRLTGNNRSEAARILGINRKTLLEKRKRYGIP